jgi:flavin reductase (DIM6/NTAB) family NADH-FMN oxidoreductase RutF
VDDHAKALYRRALGAYPTGVAVVTADDGRGGAAALTINSFVSISLDPPLVMWSLGNATDRGVWFREADAFAINILGAEDAGLAAVHARRAQFQLDPARLFRDGPGDAPAVEGVLARLWCSTYQRIPLGDHLLLVGEVTGFDGRSGDALTYFRGGYGRALAPEEGL